MLIDPCIQGGIVGNSWCLHKSWVLWQPTAVEPWTAYVWSCGVGHLWSFRLLRLLGMVGSLAVIILRPGYRKQVFTARSTMEVLLYDVYTCWVSKPSNTVEHNQSRGKRFVFHRQDGFVSSVMPDAYNDPLAVGAESWSTIKLLQSNGEYKYRWRFLITYGVYWGFSMVSVTCFCI